jgi:hypothetical protein
MGVASRRCRASWSGVQARAGVRGEATSSSCRRAGGSNLGSRRTAMQVAPRATFRQAKSSHRPSGHAAPSSSFPPFWKVSSGSAAEPLGIWTFSWPNGSC